MADEFDTELAQLEAKFLSIDPDNLVREWHDNPRNHFQVGLVRAGRLGARLKAELVCKVLEGKLSNQYRKSLAVDGKRPTEDQIKSSVVQDQAYLEAHQYKIRCMVAESVVDVLHEASEMRERSLMRITNIMKLGLPENEENEMVNEALRQMRDSYAAQRARARSTPQE